MLRTVWALPYGTDQPPPVRTISILDLILDKGMGQCVVQGNSLGRIQRENLIQQILQLRNFTNLVIW